MAKKVQARTWGLIIPCEWANHMNIVHKAKSVAKYYYWIKHDRDYYTEPDDNAENPHAVGELKKPHIHLLMTFNSSRDLKTLPSYFTEFPELKQNSFEKISNAYGAKRYLIHADNPEKFQYDKYEVETNDRLFLNCFIEKMSKCDMLDKFLDAYDADVPTMRQYCEGFRPMLMEMPAAQMSAALANYRKEWRLKNELKEFTRRVEISKIPY